MEYRKFIDITDEEVAELAKYVFQAIEVKDVTRDECGHVSCEILTGNWGPTNEMIWDDVTFSDPFVAGENAIELPQSEILGDDYIRFQQFCFAKGFFPEYLTVDNPLLKEDS